MKNTKDILVIAYLERVGGALYTSPSAAAKAIVGRAANGWRFWSYKKGVDWVPLSDLRK